MSANSPAFLRQVEDLEAAEAIRQLKAYYAWACDVKFNDLHEPLPQEQIDPIVRTMVESVFTPDAVWDGSGTGGAERGFYVGHDEIFGRIRQTRLRFAMHAYINPDLRITGDTARATWMLWHPCTLSPSGHPTDPTGDTALWLSGLCQDEYVRTPEGWRIAKYTFRPKFRVPFGKSWARETHPAKEST